MKDHVYLGRYQAIHAIGEGGMSTVWLAHDSKTKRNVVVKVMRAELSSDPKCREAFRREMDFLSQFRHPYAVDFYQASLNDPGGPCIVMEQVLGTPLDELLERHGRMPPDRVGRLLGQLCAMLQALHDAGYVHRDLKPGNIIVVGADSPDERVKVIDFGLSRKLIGQAESPYIPIEKITTYSSGTPDYMSPEQLGDNAMDQRGDIYSVGIMLYELLTGGRPFRQRTPDELLRAHAEMPPPPFPRELEIPAAIEAVVRSCLAKMPADRPRSMRELATRFEEALGQQIWPDERPSKLPQGMPMASQPILQLPSDPDMVAFEMEAWMPAQIAEMKLKGFLNDIGGEVTESVPGLIRVYLKRPRASADPVPSGGFLAWLGFGKKPPEPEADLVEMEVRMATTGPAKTNHLQINSTLRMVRGQRPDDWNQWCDRIIREMSAYLIAKRL